MATSFINYTKMCPACNKMMESFLIQYPFGEKPVLTEQPSGDFSVTYKPSGGPCVSITCSSDHPRKPVKPE